MFLQRLLQIGNHQIAPESQTFSPFSRVSQKNRLSWPELRKVEKFCSNVCSRVPHADDLTRKP